MVFHITQMRAWVDAKEKGIFTTETLKDDGFIHCSEDHQVIKVANHMFKEVSDLVVLFIDENRVHSEIRFEDCNESG